jgi:hypothetical protein
MARLIPTNIKTLIRAKKNLLIIFCLVLLATVTMYISLSKEKTENTERLPATKAEFVENKEGKGGSVDKVIKFHRLAVGAWKNNKKDLAKDYALISQKELNNLNYEQMGDLSSQSQIALDLHDLINGRYYGSED